MQQTPQSVNHQQQVNKGQLVDMYEDKALLADRGDGLAYPVSSVCICVRHWCK